MGGILERRIRTAWKTLEALLKTNDSSLNNEVPRTVIVEIETTINSRSLIVETMSNINSEIPLPTSHLLTMKTDFILPPPEIFLKPVNF